MWSKERIKEQIYSTTPNDVVIQNLSFFPGKIVISGYGHVSKIGQLKNIEKQLSLKSSWSIKYILTPIQGGFDKEVLDSIFTSIPNLEIDSINIDKNTRLIWIIFQKNPISLLNSLLGVESKIKLKIKVKGLESEKFLSLGELSEIARQNDISDAFVNPKIDVQDLRSKIETLLPSWIKTSKISISSDRVEIQTQNDLSDIERIGFLTLLLESQIGLKIEIKQSFNYENQIETLKKLLSDHFANFSIENTNIQENVIVAYFDFPLMDEQLIKIKNELYKKTKLEIQKFICKFDENAEKICLALKTWLTNNHPILEYCFVYYNNKDRRFDVVLPEENSSIEDLTLDVFEKEIGESYKFPYPFQVKWIEENPVFYLEERIFIGEFKTKLEKIQYDKPKITIFFNDLSTIPFLIWEKIVFRLIRFEIILIDSLTNQSKSIFEFHDFIQQLDSSKICELLLKLIPLNMDSAINSIYFDELKNSFIIKYDNMFIKKEIKAFGEKWGETLKIKVNILPTKEPDEIVFQIVSKLPEWLNNPKVHFDSKSDRLLFIVQNDYEDENQLEKLIGEISNEFLVPIKLQINLPVQRIKQIVYQSLTDLIEISRLKVYPEKNNIYFEGILKSDQDEELLEEEIARVEAKTKFTIESYVKRKNMATNRESVHDLLQKLLSTYEILPFSEELYQEADLIEQFNFSKHGIDRIDLRDLDCFSIDPTGTKAIDECISVQRITNQGKDDELLIGIHVSDVVFFIPKDSNIDKEAKRRGFSVYLNHQKETYPLFPENLIEKMSLQEGQERPTLSLFIRSSLDSNIEEFFLKKTIIKNKKQFTYTEVNENLIEQKGEFLTDLQLLVSITSQFKSNRILRGSINLDFMPDNIADQIISELMIMANRLVGYHLQSLPGQKLFRNQHIQSYTYLLLQKNFSSIGYNLDILNKNPLTDINRILQDAALNGDSELIMSELRNFLSNAYYSHTCTGHEALGSKWYTQYTSPLRKYMDLIVHRLLNREYIEDLHYLCQYCSAVERLLKIKIDSTINTYFLEKVQSLIDLNKEFSVQIHKQTSKHLILSTDQDFFLFVLLSNDVVINNASKNILETFLKYLQEEPFPRIRIKDVFKDKKDINIFFNFTYNGQNISGDVIKAKLMSIEN